MNIFDTPSSKRNSAWESSFLEAFPKLDLYLNSDEPFQGPDSFSYMDVNTEGVGQKVNLEEFLSWCGHAGVGLVLNLKANKTPDYVFNYGMIWNFILRDKFLNDEASKEDSKTEQKSVLVHKILEGYLPQFVRKNIREFLKANRIIGVKIGLISRGDGTPYETIWHFPNNTDLADKDQRALLESISWFLPLDYKVAVAMEDDPSLRLENL